MSAMELNTTVLKDNANLKAYYRFESGAETTDSSGNSHTLTAIATPTFSAGKFGQGVDYASASSQAHSIVDHADLKPTGAFSIGAWFKIASTTGQHEIFSSYYQAPVAGITFGINCDNLNSHKLELLTGKNTGAVINTDFKVVSSTTSVDDNIWHFGVATWNGSILSIYVDSRCESSISWANAPVYNASSAVRIGCRNNSGNALFWNGSIDDVFLLNGTALSPDQIKELYEGRILGEGYPQSGLVAGYHLNGNSTDFSGNNNHGTDTAITYSQANGKFGQGAGFNGTTSFINLGNPSVLQTSTFTMSFFAKPSRTSTNNAILGAQTGEAPSITFDASNHLRLVKLDIADIGATASTISTSSWGFYVITYDGTNWKWYINGRLDNSGSNAQTFTYGNRIFGKYSTSSAIFYQGALDEFQIYNVVKDAQWVRRQYALGRGLLV